MHLTFMIRVGIHFSPACHRRENDAFAGDAVRPSDASPRENNQKCTATQSSLVEGVSFS